MIRLARKISQDIYYHKLPHLLAVILFVAGCAKPGFPPGGPVDKESPQILATFPASGKVNTPLDTEIEIIFNEAINPKTVVPSLYFSPRFDVEPKIKIKSDRIIIQPKGPLAPNRTYLFTLGTDLKDAHNVNLDQAFSLAFSTGSSIDSGRISGTVYKEGKATANVSMALFEVIPDSSASPDSLKPDYVTQTGKNGEYAFEFIAPDDYYLVAFEDKNKNRKIDITHEAVGLPFLQTNLSMTFDKVENVNIRLHKIIDKTRLSLISSSVNPDRMLRIKFNRPLAEIEAVKLFESANIKSDSATEQLMFSTYFPLIAYPASEFLILLDNRISETEYLIRFDQSAIISNIDDSLKIISSHFSYAKTKDNKPPRLLYQTPTLSKEAIFQPGEEWQFQFSEAINSELFQQGVRVIGAAGDTLPVEVSIVNPTVMSLKPSQLQPGSIYDLIIDPVNLTDRSGNQSSDSSIIYRFATIGTDTLGSISGAVLVTDSTYSATTIIEFKPVKKGEGRPASISLPPGQVIFLTSLFPGYYTISAWVDQNENQVYDYGTIIPYHRAEPFTMPVDTFRVRTRFESAGVEIKF